MEKGDANKLLSDLLTEKTLAKASSDIQENDELALLRAQRLQQLKQNRPSSKIEGVVEVKESELIQLTTSAKSTVVCHFFEDEFKTCDHMDSHLSALADKYQEIRFVRLKASKAKFLTTKLRVRTLPTVIGWIDGKTVMRIIGFEGLGDGVVFETDDLEEKLEEAGIFKFA